MVDVGEENAARLETIREGLARNQMVDHGCWDGLSWRPFFPCERLGLPGNHRLVEWGLAWSVYEGITYPLWRPVLEVCDEAGAGVFEGLPVRTPKRTVSRIEELEGAGVGGEFGVIVVLSMLEGAKQPVRLFRRLANELLAPGGRLFVTVSMGLHAELDALLLSGEIREARFYRRTRERSDGVQYLWERAGREGLGTPRYGEPFPEANVLAVINVHRPLD